MRDLDAFARFRFVNALQDLISTGLFAQFVPVHATYGAHGTPSFFPWHRLFLLELEEALMTMDPTVTLPYCTCPAIGPRLTIGRVAPAEAHVTLACRVNGCGPKRADPLLKFTPAWTGLGPSHPWRPSPGIGGPF